MEMSLGGVLLFATMFVLALIGRFSARYSDHVLFSGDVAPALIAVGTTALMTIGLVMMLIGGETYVASLSIKLAIIFPLMIIGAWLATRMAGRQ